MCHILEYRDRENCTDESEKAESIEKAVARAKELAVQNNCEVTIYQPIRVVRAETRAVVEEYREPPRPAAEARAQA